MLGAVELSRQALAVLDSRPERHPRDLGRVLWCRHLLQALLRVLPGLGGMYAFVVCGSVDLRAGRRESPDTTNCGCH